jgi:hypothetical protein
MRGVLRRLSLLAWWCALSACSGGKPGAPIADDSAAGSDSDSSAAGAAATAGVELGTPGGDDGLGFEPLLDGDVLRLQTFGQGGTHVLTAVRCTGFGSRAFVSGSLLDPLTGIEVSEPPPARPQLLFCEQGVCDLVPFLVHASGLTKTPEERDGLHATLSAQVHNEAGASAETSREIVLSTADL